jgi:hypothetical protein
MDLQPKKRDSIDTEPKYQQLSEESDSKYH